MAAPNCLTLDCGEKTVGRFLAAYVYYCPICGRYTCKKFFLSNQPPAGGYFAPSFQKKLLQGVSCHLRGPAWHETSWRMPSGRNLGQREAPANQPCTPAQAAGEFLLQAKDGCACRLPKAAFSQTE
jgi:hypothetical protein